MMLATKANKERLNMKKYYFSCCLLLLSSLGARAGTEGWVVQEESGAGNWTVTITGSQISGSATTRYGEQESEFDLSGEMQGGKYHINRLDPDQSEPCFYRSEQETEESIIGSLTCGETSQSWVVLRRIKLE